MPLYYFDLRDNGVLTRDDFGTDSRSADGARVQAVIALTEMARDWLPADGAHRCISLTVRLAEVAILEISMDFTVHALSAAADHMVLEGKAI